MSDSRSLNKSRTLQGPPRSLKRPLPEDHDLESRSHASVMESSSSSDPYPKYAHLSYAPATKTTVVTTTTTTTTSFPAFLIDSPQGLHSRDPQQYPLASTPTPSSLTQFTFQAGGRTALFREESSTNTTKAELNSHHTTLETGIEVPIAISPEFETASPLSNPRKRPAAEITSDSFQNTSPKPSIAVNKKSRHRLRDINNTPITPRSRTITRSRRYGSNEATQIPQASPVSLSGDTSLATTQNEDSSTDTDIAAVSVRAAVTNALPPSPPSFISAIAGVATPPVGDQDLAVFDPTVRPLVSEIDSIGASPHAAQDNSLPSPMLSPVTASASPILDDAQFDDADVLLPEKALLPFADQSLESTAHQLPKSIDRSSAPLADLFKLVDTFDAYPIELQRYAMYQLLRRSNKHLLQFTADLVNPALKCDFIARLPTELSLNIIQHLDAKTLCRAAQVSRRWRELTDSYDQVWKDLVEEESFTLPQGEIERAVQEGWKWQGVMPAEKNLSHLLLRRPSSFLTFPTLAGTLTRSCDLMKRGTKRSAEHLETSKKRRKTVKPSDVSAAESPTHSRTSLQLDFQALTADLPELGLKSLRIPHLYKSIYRRHHGFRSGWMDPETKPHHIAFQAHGRHVVTCLQFDNDKILTGSDDTKINIWDTNSGASRKELLGHEGGVWALQYDGNILVSGSTDRTVRIWDIEKGRCLHVFQGHTSTVRCLVILKPTVVGHSSDGTPIMMPKEPLIITGSRDSTLRVWKLPKLTDTPFNPKGDVATTDGMNPYFIRALHGHIHSVRAIAAHGDTLVSGSYDSTVRVWRISSGDLVHRLAGHSQKVYSVILDHERNRCISGSMDNLVKVWSLETGQCIFNLEGHSSLVGLLDLNHNRLVSAAADWSLRIWDPETGHCRNTLAAHTGAITCFQHDGMKVVSGSDRSLKMWNVKSGELVRDLLTDLTGGWQVRFNDRKCVAAVQRNNRTYIEVLDFGAARDGLTEERLGVRTLVDEHGEEITDNSDEEDFEE